MSKNYFSAYYIFNYLLIIIYPVLRSSGNKYMLKKKDNWGYQREDSILTILVTIILLRYVRYFTNWNKFICEIFFYCKFSISILLLLISRKIAIWYLLACLIIWLLVKYPRYNGASNIIYIQNEEVFNDILNKLQHKQNEKGHKKPSNPDYYFFMIFYSNYSYDCIYTEELFAELSIKYYCTNLVFGKMNVDTNENFVQKMGINLHGYNVTLPYMILFKNGKEIERLPGNDSKGKPKRMRYYKEKDIVDVFQLKNIISLK